MQTRFLRYFVAVVDCGSLSSAARRLGVAQPALSQRIHALESELGISLLLRSPQGVEVTDAGKVLYRHARSVLLQLEEMRSEIHRASSSITGTVAIGFTPPLAAVFELPVFLEVQNRYPGIKLRIFTSVSGYLDELLINGRLDLTMLTRNDLDSNTVSIPLAKEQLSLISKKQADQQITATTELAALENLPLVLPSADQSLRRLIEKTTEREGIKLKVLADVDSLPGLLSITNTGIASTILPATALALYPDLLFSSSIIKPFIERTVSICSSRTLPITPSAQVVTNILIELAPKLLHPFTQKGITL